ncbi:amino acid ABC transporter substrate-binding protein [Kocuria coralli]|uniref:Amino acid ABC transporter substrate-binding protein n=1 Tax=Kocuria coralli TaxID=1461025 RepID=A0A5J5L2P9_9MICC|nr:ABC transporter substrate-binding protein [Kocuria coralli]KAA9395271.1 amino acid ABC transporter substrate-binding protein [Kocuria coralli]
MRTRHSTTLLAAAGAGALLLSGCTSTTGEAQSESGVPLISDGALTVCTNTPYTPFEFERDGEVVGFDMDLADEIAADLDVEKTVIQTGFEGIESGADLSTNKCDVAISGITITEARESQMAFSESYFDDELGLLVPAGSDIQSFEDIGDARVAVQQATTGQTYAEENGLNFEQQEDVELMLQKLETGGVEAVIGNVSVLGTRAAGNPDVVLADQESNGEQLGVAVGSENTEMVDAVNSTIDRIEGDGTMDRMREEWMGL